MDNREKIDDIKKKIRSNDYDYVCLNLQRVFLEDDDIKEIEDLLKDNEYVRNVKWNSKNKVIFSIENLIARNLIKFRRHPSDYVYALLSKHVYYISKFNKNDQVSFKKIEEIDENECENRDRILNGWSIEEIFIDESLDSYAGALYINKRKRQIILASKGTDEFFGVFFEKNSVVNTDLEAVFLGKFIEPVYHAFDLAREIYNKWVLKEKYNLSFTGHSLGGWFASMQCYHLQKYKKTKIVQAVVFESPGVSMNIDKISENSELPDMNLKKKDLNIITYLTVPNFVNTCNSHCGKRCYALTLNGQDSGTVGNAKNPGLFNFLITCTFVTLKNHKMDKILEYFDSKTGDFKNPDDVKKVIDWPCLKKNIDNQALLKASTHGRISRTMKRGIFNFSTNLVKICTNILPGLRTSITELNTVYTSNDQLKVFYEGHLKTEPLDYSSDFLSHNDIDNILFDAHYSQFEPYDFMSRFLKSLVKTYELNDRNITLKPNRELQFKGNNLKSIDDIRVILANMIDLENIQIKFNMSEKGLLDKFISINSILELNNFFIKRPALFDRLIVESAANNVLIIYGIPGIGKTEIIRFYVLNQHRSFFFLDAQTIQTFITGLKNISDLLEIKYNEENINEWYQDIFTWLRRYEAIFIIENLNNTEPSINEFVLYILRNNWSKNFKIFVINRTNKIKESLNLNQGEIVNCLKIQGLTFSDIKEAFVEKDLLKRGFTEKQLKELIKEFGDGVSISSFNAFKLLSFIISDNSNKTGVELILNIKKRSIDFINQEFYENIFNLLDSNFRIDFLKLISLLNYELILIDFLVYFLRLNEKKLIVSQLNLLADMGLIEISNDRSGIRVDSLFRSDLRVFIEHKEREIYKDEKKYLNENANFNYTLISNLNASYKSDCLFSIFPNWICKNNFLVKNTYTIKHLKAIFKSKVDILDEINKFYFYELLSFSKIVSYNFKMALNLYKKGIEVLEKMFTEQNLILASAMYKIAILFDYNGYYETSLLYHETSLKMRRELHQNNDHSDIAISLVGLGCINQKLGFLNKAYELKKEAFEMAKRLEEQPNYLTAYIQLEIDLINFEIGRLNEFEASNENVIKERIEFFSEKLDLDISNIWAFDVFLLQKNLEKTSSYFEKCKQIKSKILKSLLFEKTSSFYYYVGNFPEALSCCKESIRIKRQIYSNKHPQLALSYGLEAQILIKYAEKHEKIRYLLAKALKIEQIFFLDKSPNCVKINVYSALADFYEYAKRLDKAISYRTKAFIFASLLEKENPLELAKVQNDLGLTLYNLGNLNDSEKYLNDSIETIEKIENCSLKKSLLQADFLNNYGMISKAVKDKKQGLKCFKKSLDLRKKIFLDNNLPDTSNLLHSYGFDSLNLEEKTLSLESNRNYDSMSSEFSNKDSKNYIQSLINLANEYRELNELDEMLSLLNEARSYAINFSDKDSIAEIDLIILDAFSP